MPRVKMDPVDVAFRAWKALDTDQQQRLADRMAGYQEAMGVVAAPTPRTRQRKPKVSTPMVGFGERPMPGDSIPKTA